MSWAFKDIKAVLVNVRKSSDIFGWRQMVCNSLLGYKSTFNFGVTGANCIINLKRELFNLQVSNKSQIAAPSLKSISKFYYVEREIKPMTADKRLKIRQAKPKQFFRCTPPTDEAKAQTDHQRLVKAHKVRLQP